MLSLARYSTPAVLIRRRSGKDSRGFQTVTETRENITAFLDAPTVSEESPAGKAGTPDVLEHVLYLEPGTRVSARDRVEIEGSFFEVIGVAPPIKNIFTGAVFHTECKVRRVEA